MTRLDWKRVTTETDFRCDGCARRTMTIIHTTTLHDGRQFHFCSTCVAAR